MFHRLVGSPGIIIPVLVIPPLPTATIVVLGDPTTFQARITTTTPDGTIDWGDGSPVLADSTNNVHTYPHVGPWTIVYHCGHNPPNVTRFNVIAISTSPVTITDAISCDVSALVKLDRFSLTYNPDPISIDLSALPILTRASFTECSGLVSLIVPKTAFLTNISVSGGNEFLPAHGLTSIDTTNCTALSSFNILGPGNLQGVDVSTNSQIVTCLLLTNQMTSATVDSILVALAGFTKSNGTLDVSSQLPSPPGPLGLAAKVVLNGRGWSVATD